MTTPVIIDLIAAAVLVAAALWGARRGLVRALAGLTAAAVALIGAAVISNALAAPAARLVTPLIGERVQARVEAAMEERAHDAQMPEAGAEGDFSAEDLLALLGLDEDVREDLAGRAEEKLRDTGASLAMAVAESVAESVLRALLFLIAFIGLMLLLRLIAGALDMVARLPGLSALNAMGGGLIGLIEGALALFLAVWLLRRFGVSFETEAVSATRVLRFFTTHTPISAVVSFFE